MAVGLCLVALAACSSDPRRGYSFATTFPEDVRTVAVPIFDNYSDQPGIESQITEAIVKELQRSSGIRVVSDPSGADTKLSGVVTAVTMRRLTLQRQTGLTQELAVQVTVDFDWKDNRSGKLLVSRRGFATADTFVPSQPTGERIEAGQTGAVQRLAKDLVNELRTVW